MPYKVNNTGRETAAGGAGGKRFNDHDRDHAVYDPSEAERAVVGILSATRFVLACETEEGREEAASDGTPEQRSRRSKWCNRAAEGDSRGDEEYKALGARAGLVSHLFTKSLMSSVSRYSICSRGGWDFISAFLNSYSSVLQSCGYLWLTEDALEDYM